MRYFHYLSLIAFFSIALINSCSNEEEDTSPPPALVQPQEPEPPAPTQYTLTVTAGEGGTLSTEGGTYDEGTEITITATPNDGYEFIGWEGSDSDSSSLTVTLNGNVTIQPIFSPLETYYTLSIENSENGIISIQGSRVYDENGPNLESINPNTYNIENPNVLIGRYERRPSENGYHEVEIFFENGQLKWKNAAGFTWSLNLIDGDLWSGADGNYEVSKLGVYIDNNDNVLALVFNGENYDRVADTTVTKANSGTELTLIVTPKSGYQFIGWQGIDSTENQITITLNSNITVAPLFESKLSLNEFENLPNELLSFYQKYGGKEVFEQKQILALETLLLTIQDIENDDLSKARERLDNIFELIPLSDNEWFNISHQTNSTNSHCPSCPINIGGPVAYYGLRMLEQIVTFGLPSNGKSLKMTAVIASCANVTRPRLDLTSETIPLEINPKILENDMYILKISTELFRKWVQTITNGTRVDLQFYIVNDCIDVNYSFSEDGETIFSYISDVKSFIDSVPLELAEETDFWWTISPSGVPGDGSGFNKHFITGGMGGYRRTGDTRYNRPVFLSDDEWFVRKPEHMGFGEYHNIELKAYQPQFFQHEFMHYLYAIWDEYDLERLGGTNIHGWFDRNRWPSDFTGLFEPDYYAETITKRLMTANPSLENGLEFPGSPYSSLIDPNDYSIENIELFLGNYRREPVENDWHIVEIINTNGSLSWQNNAGVSWSLNLIDGKLWTGPDCVYGEQKLGAFIDSNGEISSIVFNNEVYTKVLD